MGRPTTIERDMRRQRTAMFDRAAKLLAMIRACETEAMLTLVLAETEAERSGFTPALRRVIEAERHHRAVMTHQQQLARVASMGGTDA